MSTPVIAQVHGWCLAGGSELANACDLIYVAEDAKIGYPPVRLMSPPDMQWQTWMMGLRRGMEALLTGDHMTGIEAVQSGMANRAFPEKKLDAEVLKIAERIAKFPSISLPLTKDLPIEQWKQQEYAMESGQQQIFKHLDSINHLPRNICKN